MKISYSGENVLGEWLVSSLKDLIVNVLNFLGYKECHIFFVFFFFNFLKMWKPFLAQGKDQALFSYPYMVAY